MIRTIASLVVLPAISFTQNVGIGIIPAKAKFEVSGVVGNTVAILGGYGAGISFQRNNPTIGFNQYYTDVNRNMAAGGGWVEYLDMASGSLVFDSYAQQGSPNVQNYSSTRRLTIKQNGNVVVNTINRAEANASLFVDGANVNLPSAIFRGTSYNSVF